MIRPGFQTKPVARERCEWTETSEGAAVAMVAASAVESEERGDRWDIESSMG